jgi:hypothetical protein
MGNQQSMQFFKANIKSKPCGVKRKVDNQLFYFFYILCAHFRKLKQKYCDF